jgi:hypothetical protein
MEGALAGIQTKYVPLCSEHFHHIALRLKKENVSEEHPAAIIT